MCSKSHKRTVLFYRKFVNYTGGHQKVADYFSHLQHSETFTPFIAFSNNTVWNETNPWFPEHQRYVRDFQPADYNYLFLAGMDWKKYLSLGINPDLPVINLIQGVRHGDNNHELSGFLSHKAIRLCVSPEIADAIKNTGLVNGPVITIPIGHFMPALMPEKKENEIFILGTKQQDMAKQISSILEARGVTTHLVTKFIQRHELYDVMNRSRIAILLPFQKEGFYLPALETMNYCDVIIVPDCIGNRSFCHNNRNCLVPEYTVNGIVSAALKALDLLDDREALSSIQKQCSETLGYHAIEREKHEFLNVMNQVDQLW